ncbi:EKC/KEOPS complex subunit LAGE3-like isoform X1 [Mytilus edulis]|uniref:L antigen family member 3 n=3 Tax=Mytilus TaxID=6548 RepID=A0A8B6E2V2_MYTGA|nr:EKC/KEOPS complex subunit PCC1/LAGE3 [Mytilus galloprovincialis]
MCGNTEKMKMDLTVPLSTEKEAEIVYRTLSVDKEPKRGGVTRNICLEGSHLNVHFEAAEAKMMRVSVNNFFDHFNLVVQTMEQFGPPNT